MNDIFNENVPLKTETPAFAKHVLPAVPSSEVYFEDCVTALKRFNDNHFDLAIVDPPYGIGECGAKNHSRSNATKATLYTAKNWDNEIPSAEYFEELKRVSKNQIIWGGNYFGLPASSCWIVWDKDNSGDFADCELAWTSFDTAVRKFTWRWNGMLQQNMKDKEIRIHPTQKPIALYEWLISKYAKEGDLILDTHLGSGSSRIAAYKGGFSFVGFEIDQEYYDKQEKRFNDFKSQLRLF
jgi:site-specific DNA-methyltransferase (adenine-specific)